MEVLLKIAVLVLFLATWVYRCWLWGQLEEDNGVEYESLIPDASIILYQISGLAKFLVIIFSVIVFIIFPINYFALVSGVILFFMGFILVVWGRITIGRSWAGFAEKTKSPEPLVVNGPYYLCRNPIYVGLAIEWFGMLITYTWPFLTEPIFLVLFFVILIKSAYIYHQVILAEEKFLLSRFGDDYKKYIASTPRYLPLGRLILVKISFYRHPLCLNNFNRPGVFFYPLSRKNESFIMFSLINHTVLGLIPWSDNIRLP